jgi:hypothetical protein
LYRSAVYLVLSPLLTTAVTLHLFSFLLVEGQICGAMDMTRLLY